MAQFTEEDVRAALARFNNSSLAAAMTNLTCRVCQKLFVPGEAPPLNIVCTPKCEYAYETRCMVEAMKK